MARRVSHRPRSAAPSRKLFLPPSAFPTLGFPMEEFLNCTFRDFLTLWRRPLLLREGRCEGEPAMRRSGGWTAAGSLGTMRGVYRPSPCQGAGHAIVAPARPVV